MGISGLTGAQKISGADKTPAMDTAFRGQVGHGPASQPKTEVDSSSNQNTNIVTRATREKLERIATAMADYIESMQRDLRIEVDHKTGHIVIQVISKSTGKVVRQVPPEELLHLAAKMEEMIGVIFDKSA